MLHVRHSGERKPTAANNQAKVPFHRPQRRPRPRQGSQKARNHEHNRENRPHRLPKVGRRPKEGDQEFAVIGGVFRVTLARHVALIGEVQETDRGTASDVLERLLRPGATRQIVGSQGRKERSRHLEYLRGLSPDEWA